MKTVKKRFALIIAVIFAAVSTLFAVPGVNTERLTAAGAVCCEAMPVSASGTQARNANGIALPGAEGAFAKKILECIEDD